MVMEKYVIKIKKKRKTKFIKKKYGLLSTLSVYQSLSGRRNLGKHRCETAQTVRKRIDDEIKTRALA